MSSSLESFRRPTLSLLVGVCVLSCDKSAPTDAAQELRDAPSRATVVQDAALATADETPVTTQGTIPLPINQSFASSGVAFRINQNGTGPNSNFFIQNPSNSAAAIFGQSNGSGFAVRGYMTGTGRAAQFQTVNASTGAPTLEVLNGGMGVAAAIHSTNSNNSFAPALAVTANGAGDKQPALQVTSVGRGVAAYFEAHTDIVGASALEVRQLGNGSAAEFSTGGGAFPGIPTMIVSGPRGPAATFHTADGAGGGAIMATSTCFQCAAAYFEVNSAASVVPALFVGSNGGVDSWVAQFGHSGAGGGVQITTNGGPGLQVVGGSKNAVVSARGGARALYTEESTEVWFTDYGFSRLANGHVGVRLDPTFSETVALGEPYHVFLQPYGRAEIYVTNRSRSGFDVTLKDGEPNVEFSYRVVAKRLGFESKRLERAPWADRAVASRTRR